MIKYLSAEIFDANQISTYWRDQKESSSEEIVKAYFLPKDD